jgi:peptidoglycan/LPS O-acetylase OafA/YrhL
MSTSLSTQADHSDRQFETLDGLRGIAAIAVVLFHFETNYKGDPVFPHGYLAVDFFFALSGFVLTFAYQRKLDAGQPTLSFLKARLIRLYPLYLLGLGLGTIALHHEQASKGARGGFGDFWGSLVLNLLFLPTLAGFWPAFPLDPPAWSLFSEMAMNVVHAVWLRRRSTRALVLIGAAATSGFLAVALWFHTVNFGAKETDVYWGLLRVSFSYLVGMLLCRLWQAFPHAARIPSSLGAILLLGLLWFPLNPAHVLRADLAAVCVGCPVILLLGAYAVPHPHVRRFSTLLGKSSYAMYAIHAPFLALANWACVVFLHQTLGKHEKRSAVAVICILVPLSLLLERFYDIPVRAVLRERTRRRTAA